MAEPDCEDCKFFEPGVDAGHEEDPSIGRCRRFPPVFMPHMAKAAEEPYPDGSGDEYSMALKAARDHNSWRQPIIAVENECWCGEFQPKDEPSR